MGAPERFPRRTGVAELTGRITLTPRMIRVTLRAEAFGPQWPIQQPGEIITLLFAAPGEEIVLPLTGWTFPDGAEEQEWRNYTVRRHDPHAREIDVDVVLHEPRGPACSWAQAMPVGAGVGFAGPRVDYTPRDDTSWLLLCGDETALPAIAAILEQPTSRRTLAVIEVHDHGERQPLSAPPGTEVRWVSRDGAQAATTTHLADVLRQLDLPQGPGQAWGAAESKVARGLREVLRDERGLPRTHASARGYWLRSGEWLDDED
ncbi:MAG TPA: siderophore-interacting protein [Baekduia sp.]|nr:siderophore-interacting protein [Baekduia sp.]